ncbi:LysR substrate-binding domain-containing protein [Vibrio lamellibrachiae]|uniref:LysR substrate-binding domain-containing protein n=1 Tax=Vibrio lamellibrachiae TaxID=2910253 RepID=UPI003D0FB111
MASRGFTDSQIEAFAWVMKTESATAAAEKMLISQPAISRLLKGLEERLGFALFERINNRLSPTRRGLLFYQEVERSYIAIRQLQKFADKIRDRAEGTLRVGCVSVFAINVLPKIAKQLTEYYPDIEVNLLSYRSEQIVEDMIAQRFDMGITTIMTPDSRYQSYPITLPQVCILPKGHRLEHKEIIEVSDFGGETLIYGEAQERTRRQLDTLLEQHNATPKKVWTVSLAEMAVKLVQESVGLSVVDCVSASHAKTSGVIVKPLSEELKYHANLIFPLGKNMDPALIEMSQTLKTLVLQEVERCRSAIL